jgi:fatty acid desaturase
MRDATLPVDESDLELTTRRLVSDLHTPRAAIFWADLLLSAAVGWMAFGVVIEARSVSSLTMAAFVLAALALYRGLCFTHELTHVQRRALPGFETAWNLLFGVPLLLPSFTYVGVHQSHHNLATYGTKDDPEYLPFASSSRLILTFAIQSSLLIPLLVLIRFLILAPAGLVWPRFHRWLEVRASSFAMNPAYRRAVSDAMAARMRRWELLTLAAWIGIGVLLYRGVLPPRTLVMWYAVLILVSFLNTMRTLGAHEYESDGDPRNRQAQLADSIDTPGGPWTALWAPVGLRYHALHHYFPGIPYHNLGTAYRRIIHALPADSMYKKSTSPGLRHSLKTLYVKARTRAAQLIAA